METIGVSEEVKAVLERMKEERGHTSYDSVVRELVMCRYYGNDIMDDLFVATKFEDEDYEDKIHEYSPEPGEELASRMSKQDVEARAETETEPELENED